MSNEVWVEVYERLAALIRDHRTTLVFVNTRRLAERLSRQLSDRLGADRVTAHHGSMSRSHRLDAEQRLKNGSLRALVATASLELGIDIGSVDLVCQIGSTRSIGTLLQRVGRSGHSVGGFPIGRLFPLTRDELVECTALLDSVRRGELDRFSIPTAPLDILAQQVVAAVACQEWRADDLYDMARRAYPYPALPRGGFDDVLKMLAEGFSLERGRRAALPFPPRVTCRRPAAIIRPHAAFSKPTSAFLAGRRSRSSTTWPPRSGRSASCRRRGRSFWSASSTRAAACSSSCTPPSAGGSTSPGAWLSASVFAGISTSSCRPPPPRMPSFCRSVPPTAFRSRTCSAIYARGRCGTSWCRRFSTRRCSACAGAGTPRARWRSCAFGAAGRWRRSCSACRPRTSSPRSSPTRSPAPRISPASGASPTTRSCSRRSAIASRRPWICPGSSHSWEASSGASGCSWPETPASHPRWRRRS